MSEVLAPSSEMASPDTAPRVPFPGTRGVAVAAPIRRTPAGLDWREATCLAVDRIIARIDEIISRQVRLILNHPRFRRLEASWRGVAYLIEVVEQAQGVKLKMLSASWSDVTRDVTRALEFDQSQLFFKVYEQEFGSPGGEPYGLLVGDYQISHKRSPTHPSDDVAVLTGLAQVAAAAFAPFVAGASPELLGLEDFTGLALPIDFSGTFRLPEYEPWRRLRASEDSRFLGLALPDVLVRGPYEDLGLHDDGFRYTAARESSDDEDHLWMSAVYPFAATVVQAFGRSGWFTDLRGARRGEEGGGLVENLVPAVFSTESPGVADRAGLVVEMDPGLERTLDELGLIPLVRAYATPRLAFYSNASLQEPVHYDTAMARANARLSSMLQYILCVSRFAHYIKVMGRDRVGAFSTPEECRKMLQAWIMRYCTADDDSPPSALARYPLREANIEVRERPGQPGVFACTAQLKPHFQLDQIISAFKLVTELAPKGAT